MHKFTLFRSITMFCGTGNMNVGTFRKILPVPQNIVMDMNNVMNIT